MLQKLLIEGAVRHQVVKRLLDDVCDGKLRHSVSEARIVNQWLVSNASLLPEYEDVNYVEEAIALYRRENAVKVAA